MPAPPTDRSRARSRRGPTSAKHPRNRLEGRIRQLALAMVRELRARGWSYRDIGSAFATARRGEHARRQRVESLPPALLFSRASARRGTAAEHLVFRTRST